MIQRHRGPNDPFDYQWGDEAAPLIWWNGVHEHEFTIPAARTQDPTPTQSGDALVQGLPPHRHTFPAATATKFTGVPEIAARSGTDASGKQVAAKTCFSSLRVELDGADLTGAILARTSWQRIGDGTDGHPLVTSQFGTGALDLLEMAHAAGRALGAGLHTLVFRLDDDNDSGGKVLYNLYVE